MTAKRLATMANDTMGLIGAAMVVHGVDAIYRPTAFILAGLILVGTALIVARRS